MLANVLSLLLGLGSVTFYLAGFFYPESHRRSDVVWSGLGTLYALVLWFWAEQITGIVLLAQVAVLALVLGLGWQLLTVRREKTPVYQQTPVVITPEIVADWTKNQLNQLRIAPAEPVPLRLGKRNLSDRPDPRRRPVYDYEFVEDGILETMPAEPVLEEILIELDTTGDDIAPAFADAKVLSVEVPEEAIASAHPPKPNTLAAASPEIEPPEIEPPEIEPPEIEPPEIEPPEIEPPEIEPPEIEPPAIEPPEIEPPEIEPPEIEPPSVEPPNVEPLKAAVSTEKSVPLTKAPPQVTTPTNISQKPNLLATPLILIGWLKDVITGITRPKPSKPIIEIPRRPASYTASSPTSAPSSSASAPASAPAPFSEDSNWDD